MDPKFEQEAKNTKSVLGKSVSDLTVEEMKNLVAVIETDQGPIKLKFYPDQAPNHCKNFILLAEKGFYDNLVFHRVIEEFMVQGGCPEGTGTGGPGWHVGAEFSDLPHEKGTLSMARSNDPDSAGSQFFICHERSSFLNGEYTVFGQVVEGQEVVDKIATTRTEGPDRPITPQVMKKVSIERKQ